MTWFPFPPLWPNSDEPRFLLLTLLHQQIAQRRNVGLRHLQCLVLGQLPIVSTRGKMLPQPVEGLVQPIHALPFPCIGRQAPLALDHRWNRRASLDLDLRWDIAVGQEIAIRCAAVLELFQLTQDLGGVGERSAAGRFHRGIRLR